MVQTKRGLFIAFFGPDGSGKSTVADKLVESLSCASISTSRLHWRPRVLPPKNKNKVFKYDVTKPDDMPERKSLLSLALYFYFFADFLIGYFKIILPRVRRGEFVVYERYFYDVLVHPARYRLVPYNKLGRFLSSILPSPDMIVVLHGDAGIIHKRKDELSIREIDRQQIVLKNIFKKTNHVSFIDITSQSPENIVSKILEFK